jgi:hypothetical protein
MSHRSRNPCDPPHIVGFFVHLMRQRPRGARQLSARRGDRTASRPARQSASSASSRRSGIRGCHPPRIGRIHRAGSSWPQSTRSAQRKRRPTSKVDSMTVLRGRLGGTGSKYVTLQGGLRRTIPFLLVRSGAVRKALNSIRAKRPNDPVRRSMPGKKETSGTARSVSRSFSPPSCDR